jgi:hypothetical protein
MERKGVVPEKNCGECEKFYPHDLWGYNAKRKQSEVRGIIICSGFDIKPERWAGDNCTAPGEFEQRDPEKPPTIFPVQPVQP